MFKQVLFRMGRQSIEKCGFAAFDKTRQTKGSGPRQAKVGKEQVVGDDVLAVGQGDVVQGNALKLLVGEVGQDRAFCGFNLRDFQLEVAGNVVSKTG